MGSLGDKFKKLAGDQTRQLLQNFQNAQSSKTRNGYSYGKLNEDGTATLADGTVVQTVVKGRPGQYAPVFNLGNGQGLVDQPEAKFFNIDSSGQVRFYGLSVRIKQQYSANTPNSDFFYFNMLTQDGVFLKDFINDTEYQVDPEVVALLPDFPIPTFTVGPQEFFPTTTFIGEYLCGLGFIFTPTDYPTEPCPGLVLPVLRRPSDDSYIYGSIFPLISGEGKDILLYQVSTEAYTSNISDSITGYVYNNWNVGTLAIKYVIMKDYFIEANMVRSDSISSGTYVFEDAPILRTISGGSATDLAGSTTQKLGRFQPLLSRNSDNVPQLDVLSVIYFQSTESDGDTGTRSNGSCYRMVRGVNISPITTWQYDTIDLDEGIAQGALTAIPFMGNIYGVFADNTPSLPYIGYKTNLQTYEPEGEISPPILQIILRNKFLIADTVVHSNDEIQEYLDQILGPGSDYLNMFSAGGIPIEGFYYGQFNVNLAAGYNTGNSTWISLLLNGFLSQSTTYRIIKTYTDQEGKLNGTVGRDLPYAPVSNFCIPLDVVISKDSQLYTVTYYPYSLQTFIR